MAAHALSPSTALLCKLASIAAHAGEYLSGDGHPFDLEALKTGLRDDEVQDWLNAMMIMGLAPQRRRL